MKAVILAGGEGTRLRPLTSNTPKPMLPMANLPMMEHVVRLLAEHGFDDVVVTVAFLANQIRDYFGDGSDFGVRMRYASEDSPLGTAGSVRNAAAELDDTFLVISGDVLTDVDLGGLVKAHRAAGAFATIGLVRVDDPVEFGIVITRPDGAIERFLEKPTWGQVFSDTINTGIYVLEPEVFEFIPDGEVVDFSGDVFPAALADGRVLVGEVADGYWEDVGTVEAYMRAHRDILDGRVRVHVEGFDLGEGIRLGEGADVHPEAVVEGPVIIGDNTRVEAGVELRPYTVLGTDVVVRADAALEHSVLHDHVYVASGARVRGAVVARSSDIRGNALVDDGAVLGAQCFVGEGAVVSQGVKIYPFKTVEPGASVNSSIVWESRGARTLFGRRGVRGLANVDVTPEQAVRVAMAYGTALEKGAVVTTSRDTSRAARALKRSMIAGLNLAGVNVEDAELATVPLTRFQVRNSHAHGGVTVRLAPGDPSSVEIRFFDQDGRDIDAGAQRRIERLLGREDFRRAFAGDIGDIVYPPRALEFYTAALVGAVDVERMRDRAWKVVVDYAFGATATTMPNVLAKLGLEVLAIDPYASTSSATSAFEDAPSRVARLQELVRSSGSALGVVFDPDGETATFIDDRGRALGEAQMLLALVDLVARHRPGARLALPVSVTTAAQRLAEQAGAEVTWTKVADAELMEVASSGGVAFAASTEGGYAWPAFLPAYDAAATFVQLLDLLAEGDEGLAGIVDRLPEVHVVHELVATPWERKGAVMREMLERAGEDEPQVDGVRLVHDEGWALVLPDPEDPVTHVFAEGRSEPESRRLAEELVRRIRVLAS